MAAVLRNSPVTYSFSKSGGILLKECPSTSIRYDLKADPRSWPSCRDAYEHTWMSDRSSALHFLSTTNRIKLARSMGFCPHLRCQLFNLSNADVRGFCPSGLCYTKLENGSPSFGACCFINGTFNTGNLIGYASKCQPTAKPIYKHSRIVLSSPTFSTYPEDSFERFINANRIHPKLIATQCPMVSTISDIYHMIMQENVSLWIQLTSEPQLTTNSAQKYPDCYLLSEAFEKVSFPFLRFKYISDQSNQFGSSINASILHFLSPNKSLSFIWYKNWDDFAVPDSKDSQDLLELTKIAVQVLQEGGTVAINCLSGRGRTGTFASLVLGKYLKITSQDELVDLIVSIREHRDGLVEIPSQYVWLEDMLNIQSRLRIESLIRSHPRIFSEFDYSFYLLYSIVSIFIILIPISYMIRKTRI